MRDELRKQRDTLAISGLAIIVFCVWNFVKASLISSLGMERTATMSEERAAELFDLIERNIEVAVLVIVVIALSMIASIFLRIYVGLSAVAEGRGKRRGGLYVFFAILLVISEVTAIVLVVVAGRWLGVLEYVVGSLIIDLTSVFALVEVIRSAIKVKRLSRQAEAGLATDAGR